MTSRDFCFWLQGLFELQGPKELDARQTDLIKRHLALVFVHEIDPSMGPETHQEKLNSIHAAPQPVVPQAAIAPPHTVVGISERPEVVMRC